MAGMACGQFLEEAPELALGLVFGRTRGAALAHLDRCAACRSMLDELAVVADALAGLAPDGEPSGGFTDRVVTGLRSRRPARGWLRCSR